MNHGHLVVGLGDSISYGLGDLGPGWIGPGWVARFAHQTGARRMVNLSHPGQRIGDLQSMQLPAAQVLQPDFALLSIGGNDLLRPGFDPVVLAREVAAVIRRLATRGSRVVVLGLPEPSLPPALPGWLHRVIGARTRAADAGLRLAVESAHDSTAPVFVDLWGAQHTRRGDYWHIDRMHPSPRGHQLLAEQVRRTLDLPEVREAMPVAASEGIAHHVPRWQWAVHEGIPWLVRRSVDVIPQMAAALLGDALLHREHHLPHLDVNFPDVAPCAANARSTHGGQPPMGGGRIHQERAGLSRRVDPTAQSA